MSDVTRLEVAESPWLLEVVRGRDIGRRFPVVGPSVVLGSGVGAEAGIDLSEQETGNLKRMAARQARLDVRPAGLSIVDLESPGGTFVNRRRVVSGSGEVLKEGDVIQVGGVQVRVTRLPADGLPKALTPHSSPPPQGGRGAERTGLQGGRETDRTDGFSPG
ncbi:MAG TPA: FHA domain-containing protein, partial [Isosphaeraceae bacterium]|nr:FHA domain-containing protein [Isosphaeraceae bacterium]